MPASTDHPEPDPDEQTLLEWTKTHWATARGAARHCPGLLNRRVKHVEALLEKLASEGKIPVSEVKHTNRIGQYTLAGFHADYGTSGGSNS